MAKGTNIKSFLSFILISFILHYSYQLRANEPDKEKPNVLLIYTDDHRYTGVHALGGQQVQTPNIDKLADKGVAFSQAYLMGSFVGATCIPSRAMLHSGRNLFELKAAGWSIPTEHKTIGETFKEAGYNTHIVGKWHQDKASLVRSFKTGSTIMGLGVYLVDHFRMPLWDWDASGTFPSERAYLLEYNEGDEIIRREVNEGDVQGPIGTERNGPHTSEIFASNAANYLKSYNSDDPFFMYLAFHAPHDPRQAPQKYLDMYSVDNIQLPPSYMPQHPFDNGHMFLRDEELAPWPRTPEIAKKELANYYAIITHLDAQIGKVIEALKESGKYNNTIIVFAGDSGLGVGCHGLLGKQNIYDEDGVHIPLIFSGNKIQENGVREDALCYIHDIFPTICDMADVPRPKSATGKSLVPIIKDEVDQIREYTYHAYRQHQRAIRKGDYKLIEYVKAKDYSKKDGEFISGSRVTQLFNIVNDPWETTDLSFLPEYQNQLVEMQIEMKEVANSLGDTKETVKTKYDFWNFY